MASDGNEYVSQGAEFRPSLDPIDTIYSSFEGARGGDRGGFSLSRGDDDGDGTRDEDFLNGRDDDKKRRMSKLLLLQLAPAGGRLKRPLHVRLT
ncbi:MAG: hypothetical protein KAY24_17545 [Candidatus Eisenbacteria sp.]|nr:hypothetical protein [Candidatus Eisenbacteria bacterium]